MLRKRAHLLPISFLIIISSRVCAQHCTYYPADGPGDMPSKDQIFCDHHFILPEEIKMQDKIRDFITGQMEEIAEAKKWEFYELDEYSEGQYLLPAEHNKEAYPVPFSLRAPHGFQISFVFIVNTDSIDVWKSWYNEMAENVQGIANDMKSNFDDPAFVAAEKAYMDSADLWSGLLVDYETKNMQTFQQAALDKDDAFLKKYETVTKNYESHVAYWTKKASNRSQAAMSSSEEALKQTQNNSHLKIDAFRNATMVRVTFHFNDNKTSAAESDDIHLVKELAESSTSLEQIYHNSKTSGERVYRFDEFNNSTDLALVLFGKWNTTPDKYRQYHAVYTMDKKNTDKVSVKTITCDKIQTISMHIEGRPDYIESFLNKLNISSYNNMLIK
jgi:hypothetical protein